MYENIKDKFHWSQYSLKNEPLSCKIVTKSIVISNLFYAEVPPEKENYFTVTPQNICKILKKHVTVESLVSS